MSLVGRLKDRLGPTSVVVTPHVHETLPVADRAVVIADGRLVFTGTPAQLQASTNPLVRQFLDGEPNGPIPFDNSTFNTASAPRTSAHAVRPRQDAA